MSLSRWVAVLAFLVSNPGNAHADVGEPLVDDAALEEVLSELDGLGCGACHSLDGTKRVGPSFLGLIDDGAVTVADAGGTARPLVVDDAYLIQSIRQPAALARRGYRTGTMPAYELSDEQLGRIVAALHRLSDPDEVARRTTGEGSMLLLLLACVLFVGGHLVLSHRSVRPHLVRRLGPKMFMSAYSLIVGAALGFEIWAWTRAPYVELWIVSGWVGWVPMLLMPFVLVLFVAAFTSHNRLDTDPDSDDDPASGVARITRHPMNVAIALWALCHIPPNGDLAALLFFGSFIILVVFGTLDAEGRRRRDPKQDWRRVEKVTSIIPFVAAREGRTDVSFSDVGIVAVVGGVAVLLLVLFWYHQAVIGASPWPW